MASDSNLVQAIYTFKGKNNDELCFKKGDVITVSQREEGGWWEGTLGDVTGWFPSNYVKEYKDSGGSAATSPVRAPSEIQAFRNVVLKDIIDSEKAHVAELQGLVNNFLKPLENSDILTRDEYKQLTGNILEVLHTHEELLALIEECGAKIGPDQRVGGLFLQWAPKLKSVHETYCASHPRAVCILDKFKDELNSFMERCGAVCPGILVLTTGLSKPFRRLHKYAAMLQELGRHVLESHPDRGDTHRAVVVYKDIASVCSATRRQKELELQVVTGAVRGWRYPAGLGEVLHMGGVALGVKHHDRYLVLFPSTLLVLSVSKRMSAFVYEGSLPLTGITVTKLEDTDTRKNAFEISGPLIETIVAVCQTSTEAEKWVSLLQQHSNQGQSLIAPGNQSQSPTHETICLSSSDNLNRPKSRNPRESLYHVTLPPSSYPPASPYAALSKYFAKLVRLRVITRAILKQLLYVQTGIPPPDLSTVKYRHRHTSHVTLRLNDQGEVESDYSDTESETDSATSNSRDYCLSESDLTSIAKIARQDALDHGSHRTSTSSSVSNPFGYVRYYNTSSKSDEKGCEKVYHDRLPENDNYQHFRSTEDGNESLEVQPEQCPVIRILPEMSEESNQSECARVPLAFINQYSEGSDNSSFDCGNSKPYMACEDLVNLDQNLEMESLGFDTFNRIHPMRQSCPTKFVANRFNDSSLTSVCTPGWQSCSENSLSKPEENINIDNMYDKDLLNNYTEKEWDSAPKNIISDFDFYPSHKSNESVINKVLQNLEPPNPVLYELSASESTCSDISQETVIKMILDPPPMFQNKDVEVEKANVNFRKSGFENHSINSDKKIRRSSSKLSDITHYKESSVPLTLRSKNKVNDSRQCVSCNFSHTPETEYVSGGKCTCCNRSRCHSPRSSDSGVAGSCNMASPETLHRDSLYSPGETRSLNEACYPKTLHHDYSMSTGEICKLNYMRNKLSISELEAATFEAQCPCTSPFSTPRTSCQPSITSENIIVGTLDMADMSVTTSFRDSIPYPPSTSKNVKCSKNAVYEDKTFTHKEKPHLYRKPSKHSELPKNVRIAAVAHGWSTPDISNLNKVKPSTHYHMRIYREQSEPKCEPMPSERQSRKNTSQHKEETPDMVQMRSSSGNSSQSDRRIRSRSEDLAKKYSTAKSSQPGHIIYRSDLYAHWWMKAKLPITVITSDVNDGVREQYEWHGSDKP